MKCVTLKSVAPPGSISRVRGVGSTRLIAHSKDNEYAECLYKPVFAISISSLSYTPKSAKTAFFADLQTPNFSTFASWACAIIDSYVGPLPAYFIKQKLSSNSKCLLKYFCLPLKPLFFSYTRTSAFRAVHSERLEIFFSTGKGKVWTYI